MRGSCFSHYPWEERICSSHNIIDTFDLLDVQRLDVLHNTCFLWHVFSIWAASLCFSLQPEQRFFSMLWWSEGIFHGSVFSSYGGWSSTIPQALGSGVISSLSEHNGWKLSYYLSVLSKGKGSSGRAERPRKTLVLILLRGVGQPSQILLS